MALIFFQFDESCQFQQGGYNVYFRLFSFHLEVDFDVKSSLIFAISVHYITIVIADSLFKIF